MIKPITHDEPGSFRNFYQCPACGTHWTDEWFAQCDDDCPHCGERHISPIKSDHISAQADGT